MAHVQTSQCKNVYVILSGVAADVGHCNTKAQVKVRVRFVSFLYCAYDRESVLSMSQRRALLPAKLHARTDLLTCVQM